MTRLVKTSVFGRYHCYERIAIMCCDKIWACQSGCCGLPAGLAPLEVAEAFHVKLYVVMTTV